MALSEFKNIYVNMKVNETDPNKQFWFYNSWEFALELSQEQLALQMPTSTQIQAIM